MYSSFEIFINAIKKMKDQSLYMEFHRQRNLCKGTVCKSDRICACKILENELLKRGLPGRVGR